MFLTHLSSLFHTQYVGTRSESLGLPSLEFPVSEQIKRLKERREELDKQRDELDKQREELDKQREELDKQRDELDNQIFKLSAQQESQQQITLHSDVKVKGNCQQLRSSAAKSEPVLMTMVLHYQLLPA